MASGSGGLPPAREALLKSYQTRLKEDVRCMLENFQEILLLARRDSNMQMRKSTQVEQDTLEMQVRSSNMVRAGESLLKLVSDLKQYTILNDFRSANEAIMTNGQIARVTQAEIDKRLSTLRDDMDDELFEMEDEYYTSIHK